MKIKIGDILLFKVIPRAGLASFAGVCKIVDLKQHHYGVDAPLNSRRSPRSYSQWTVYIDWQRQDGSFSGKALSRYRPGEIAFAPMSATSLSEFESFTNFMVERAETEMQTEKK